MDASLRSPCFEGRKSVLKLDSLGEFGLISRLTRNLGKGRPGVVVGVGDDAAVLETGGDDLLLLTCDAQIQDVHFKFEWSTPEQVGRRAASVNLSDIAAMGGEPTYALISLQVPSDIYVDVLDGLYSGLTKGFDEWNVQIVGGNTARQPERTAIDITLVGTVPKKNLLLRSGALPGDVLCVTGNLGASAAGLEMLKRSGGELAENDLDEARRSYLEPFPRVAEGLFLGETGKVTSCIDISDGLLGDAEHVGEQSGVVLVIDLDRIPMSDATLGISSMFGLDAHDFALKGGEDFELLFTVSPNSVTEIIEGLHSKTGTIATVIGKVESGKKGVRLERVGREVNVTTGSFDHFGVLSRGDETP